MAKASSNNGGRGFESVRGVFSAKTTALCITDMTTDEDTSADRATETSSSGHLPLGVDTNSGSMTRKRSKSETSRHIWCGHGGHEARQLVELQKVGWCWKGYGSGQKPGATNDTNLYFERGTTRLLTKELFELCESVERGYKVYKLNEEEDDRLGVLRWLISHVAAEPLIKTNGNDVSAELKAAIARPMDLQMTLDMALEKGPETIEDNVKLCFSNAHTCGMHGASNMRDAAKVLEMRFEDAMRCIAPKKKRRVYDSHHHDTQSITCECQEAGDSTVANTVDGATAVVERIVAELSIARTLLSQLDKKQELLAKTVELHASSPHGLEIILTNAQDQLDKLLEEKRTLEATILRLAADLEDSKESALRSISRANLLALAFYSLKRNRTETEATHQRSLFRHRREAAAAYIEASRRERERMRKNEQLQQAALDAAAVSNEAIYAAALKRDHDIDQALRRVLVAKRADLKLNYCALPTKSANDITQCTMA